MEFGHGPTTKKERTNYEKTNRNDGCIIYCGNDGRLTLKPSPPTRQHPYWQHPDGWKKTEACAISTATATI